MKRLALSFLLTAFAGRLWSFALGADEEWLSYRQVERGTPQPIAGIPNADFEDSTKFSRPVTEGAAWSAAKGMSQTKVKSRMYASLFPTER